MSLVWLIAAIPLIPTIFLVSFDVCHKFFPSKDIAYIKLTFGLTWLAALIAFGYSIWNESRSLPVLTVNINAKAVTIFGFLADRLSLTIALLVITVSGVVHLYSLRAMQEEKHFRRYFALLTLVTIAVLLVVLSDNLLMLAIFWILKGVTLTFLLAHYQERQASWKGAMRKLRLDVGGDLAFVLALVIAWNNFGTFDLQTINQNASHVAQTNGLQLTLMTVLLFVAAMIKSAQFPFHTWLPDSVEAPTPVSALMHAGLINAGGFLFVRLSSLFVATPFTMGLAIVIGGFTALYGTTIMLTRNDVKGSLVYSTMGQMGFMMLECGLGAFSLAILHIVAHGFFKARLFLSSGSVIQEKTTIQLIAPTHPHTQKFTTPRLLLASGLAALLLIGGETIFGFTISTGSLLLIFAWVTISTALPKAAKLPVVPFFAGLIVFVGLYVLALHAIEVFYSPVIAATTAADPRLLVVFGVVLFGAAVVSIMLQNAIRPAWLDNLFKKLYVRLMFIGYGR